MKKISILIYSLDSGGAEKNVSIILNELNNKYDITLVLMSDIIFYEIPDNIKVIYLEKSVFTENRFLKLLKLPILGLKYKKILEKNAISVSLSFMNRPNYINVFSKIFGSKAKTIISERAMPSLQHKIGFQGFINRILIRLLYRRADIVTANSKGNSLDLCSNFYIKKVITIYNPVKILEKGIIKLNGNKKFIFISIGRLDKGKNHKLIINSIKNIDANLFIIGDGILRYELEKQIKKNRLENKVFLLGKQKNPYQFLLKADCFVFASNYEGFPNVILEALSCGLPIISTDCKSGPREILAPNTNLKKQIKEIEIAQYGILVPVNNSEKMMEAMKLLYNNKFLRKKLSEKALKRRYDFSLDKVIKKYINVIER